MRSIFLALLVLLAVSEGFPQQMVKVNIVELYDKVPVPPGDAKEAYARCDHGPGGTACDPGKFYQSIIQREKDLELRLGETSRQLSQPMTGQMQKGDAEAMQKKMETMSQAEKVQYAMEMSKQMGLGPRALSPEPPEVQAALREYTRANQEVGQDIQKAGDEMRVRQQIDEERHRKHVEIDAWTKTEADKIPQVSGGEMSWPEPKAYHALMVRSAQKHVEVENDYLKTVRKLYQAEMDKGKKRYAILQAKLAAINYGDDAKNIETRKILVGAQSLMMGPLGSLIVLSQDATKQSAEWYARKLEEEQKKPG
jgi:hypothetical protein